MLNRTGRSLSWLLQSNPKNNEIWIWHTKQHLMIPLALSPCSEEQQQSVTMTRQWCHTSIENSRCAMVPQNVMSPWQKTCWRNHAPTFDVVWIKNWCVKVRWEMSRLPKKQEAKEKTWTHPSKASWVTALGTLVWTWLAHIKLDVKERKPCAFIKQLPWLIQPQDGSKSSNQKLKRLMLLPT